MAEPKDNDIYRIFRKNTTVIEGRLRIQKHMIYEWKVTFMDSLGACGLHVITCSIWDSPPSWTRCERTTSYQLCHLTCNLISLQFLLASHEHYATWCGTLDLIFKVAPKETTAGICVRRSRDNSAVQRWATGWIIGGSSPGNFSLHHSIQTGFGGRGPTQPPIECVPGALSLGGKATGAWSWSLTSI
jgi:hypothetical protein